MNGLTVFYNRNLKSKKKAFVVFAVIFTLKDLI